MACSLFTCASSHRPSRVLVFNVTSPWPSSRRIPLPLEFSEFSWILLELHWFFRASALFTYASILSSLFTDLINRLENSLLIALFQLPHYFWSSSTVYPYFFHDCILATALCSLYWSSLHVQHYRRPTHSIVWIFHCNSLLLQAFPTALY